MSLGNGSRSIGGKGCYFKSGPFSSGTAPVNVTAPVLSGLSLVGETLTSTQGTWSGTPPISYIYSFYRNGSTLLQQSSSPDYVLVSADSGNYISCLVGATNAFGSGFSESNDIYISNADLVNLQSYDTSKFTLVGSKISVWADQNGANSTWVQGTDSRRPTLTSGVPIFPGSSSFMQRNSGELSLTTFSAYIVLQNANKTTFRGVFSGITNQNWMDMNNMWQSNTSRVSFSMGHTGNREVILVYKRNGSTCEMWYNGRKLIMSASTWSGEASLIGNIMGLSWNTGWSIGGPCKSVVISSEFHTDAQTAQLVDSLYTKYSLSADEDIDTILTMGDSNTVGTGTNSYIVNLSTRMALNYTNLGISGCLLTNLGANPATSVINRYVSQLETKPKKDWIVIQAGTNDILGSISSANYEAQYNTILNDLVNTFGYQANRIIICSPPYQRDGANAATLAAYNTICSNLATTYGTKYVNLYGATLALGNTCLSDTVHLNALGQTTWEDLVYIAMTT
jgi:lysophospholipase L1-like esterase